MAVCLNNLKSEIKTLEKLFTKSHELFQIVNASVDELTCRFISKNGKKTDIHANITVSPCLISSLFFPSMFPRKEMVQWIFFVPCVWKKEKISRNGQQRVDGRTGKFRWHWWKNIWLGVALVIVRTLSIEALAHSREMEENHLAHHNFYYGSHIYAPQRKMHRAVACVRRHRLILLSRRASL